MLVEGPISFEYTWLMMMTRQCKRYCHHVVAKRCEVPNSNIPITSHPDKHYKRDVATTKSKKKRLARERKKGVVW